MTRADKPGRDNEGSVERTLTGAILRINASLDLDTVLREAVDGARGLTGARLGMIATFDAAGAPGEFIFSGFTPAESRELGAWSGPWEPFRAPARTAYDATGAGSCGLCPRAWGSRLRRRSPVPSRAHRCTIVVSTSATSFLAEKAGGAEFTD